MKIEWKIEKEKKIQSRREPKKIGDIKGTWCTARLHSTKWVRWDWLICCCCCKGGSTTSQSAGRATGQGSPGCLPRRRRHLGGATRGEGAGGKRPQRLRPHLRSRSASLFPQLEISPALTLGRRVPQILDQHYAFEHKESTVSQGKMNMYHEALYPQEQGRTSVVPRVRYRAHMLLGSAN